MVQYDGLLEWIGVDLSEQTSEKKDDRSIILFLSWILLRFEPFILYYRVEHSNTLHCFIGDCLGTCPR